MSYIALYRKYRPQKFSEVVGQETIVKILANSIIENKIAHAYLFNGPRGTGKTSIAKIFARNVNCLNPINGDACGECEICQKIKTNDTDIIEIDAASNNGVDEIREIRNNTKLTPNVAKYKVYIIDEVHMLSSGAFNALLKTLEEPPAHVIFILATTEIQKIPLTILSRCQKFDFHKINDETMKEHLLYILKNEKRELKDNIIDLIVKLSDGCCRDAINLLDQILSSNGEVTEEDVYDLSGEVSNKFIYGLLDTIVKNDLKSGLELIDEFNKKGRNFNILVNKMLIIFRNLLVIKYNKSIFDETERENLEKYDQITDEEILSSTKLIIELSNEIKKSLMQKLIFEIYYMQICNIFNKSATDLSNLSESNIELENKDESKAIIEIKTSEEIQEDESLKETRINNVLAKADKTVLKNIKEKYANIDEYSSNKTFINVFSILEEGKPIVASDEYVMLEFENESYVTMLFKNLVEAESLMKKIVGSKVKLVGITTDEWKITKQEYIKNREKFVYKKENNESEKKIEKKEKEVTDSNSAIDIFGEDLVTIK